MLKLAAKEPASRILRRTKLLTEPLRPEERDPGLGHIDRPGSPYQPSIEVQSPWGMGKTSNGFPFQGNAMLVNFFVKRLADGDGVGLNFGSCVIRRRFIVEPESHAIKEVKTRKVDELGAAWPLVGSEKDCSGKNPFKACNQATVVGAVFGQAKEIEQLSSRVKVDGSALLFEGECSDPYGDEPVLTERDGRFIMHLPQ